MTHTLTDAQSLTIADALTHTLTASDRRQRRIGDALFFRNPIRTERSGGRMGSQPTHTLSASEMRYYAKESLSASLPENEGMSATRTRFQLTPDAVRGRTTNAACTATRCR